MFGQAVEIWQRQLRQVPPLVVDALLAVALAAFIVAAMQNDPEAGGPSPDALGYLLGLTPAALVFARRRWPLATLLVSGVAISIYHSVNYPPISFAMPLAIAVYTAAAAGWSGLTIVLAVAAGAGTVLVRMLVEGESLLSAGPDSLSDTALVSAMAFWGLAVRNRRAYQAEARQRLQLAEQEREREAQQRVTEERLRIARELHDVLAHTVTLISVQTGVAAELIRDNPEQAETALRTARAASKNAVTEIRAAVGVLRERDAAGADADGSGGGRPGVPAVGIAQLDTLIGQARSGGLEVELVIGGEPREIPAAVDLTAYRIVQESLTNVRRHARATAATVTVTRQAAAVEIEVRDDGRGPQPAAAGGTSSGFGVAGMRERAASVGGRLETGVAPGGGFRVHAWLPLAGRA